jgi:hypothetical protein
MKPAVFRLLSLLVMTSLAILGARAADDAQSMPKQQMMTSPLRPMGTSLA